MPYSTPRRRRGGSRAPRTPATPARRKGLFDDGVWRCDCEPRLPALHLQVKKNTANKGKWFYKCPNYACDFFLFEDQALARERAAPGGSETSFSSRIGPRSRDASPSRAPAPAPPSAAAAAAARQRVFHGAPAAGENARAVSDTDEEMALEEAAARGRGGAAAAPGPPPTQQQQQQQQQQQPAVPATQGDPATPARRARRRSSAAGSRTLDTYFAPTQADKRKRPAADVGGPDEEDFDDAAFDSDMERQLAQAADDSARKLAGAARPEGAGGAAPGPSTPSARRGAPAGGIPTPATRNSLLIAAEARGERGGSSVKRVKFAADLASASASASTAAAAAGDGPGRDDAATPTPARRRDALAAPDGGATPDTPGTPSGGGGAGGSGGGDYDVTEEVLALLAGEPVSAAARRAVRDALNRHALRVRGVHKGRDLARAALEARDARVAALQARVAALENARRADRERVRALRAGLAILEGGGDGDGDVDGDA